MLPRWPVPRSKSASMRLAEAASVLSPRLHSNKGHHAKLFTGDKRVEDLALNPRSRQRGLRQYDSVEHAMASSAN